MHAHGLADCARAAPVTSALRAVDHRRTFGPGDDDEDLVLVMTGLARHPKREARMGSPTGQLITTPA